MLLFDNCRFTAPVLLLKVDFHVVRIGFELSVFESISILLVEGR